MNQGKEKCRNTAPGTKMENDTKRETFPRKKFPKPERGEGRSSFPQAGFAPAVPEPEPGQEQEASLHMAFSFLLENSMQEYENPLATTLQFPVQRKYERQGRPRRVAERGETAERGNPRAFLFPGFFSEFRRRPRKTASRTHPEQFPPSRTAKPQKT